MKNALLTKTGKEGRFYIVFGLQSMRTVVCIADCVGILDQNVHCDERSDSTDKGTKDVPKKYGCSVLLKT